MHARQIGLLTFAAVLLCRCSLVWAVQPQAVPDYSTVVAPLLQKYCAGCHNATDREGQLSLDSFADLQRGGEHGPALAPGQPESSRLLLMISGSLEPRMPPDDSERPTDAEIELLRAWIAGGARGPEGQEIDRRTLLTPKLTPASSADQEISAFALSPDGKTAAVGKFGQVLLLDAGSGETLRTLGDLPGKVNNLSFSRDGSTLTAASGVAGLYGQATIWNVADGARLGEFVEHRDTLYDAELSPDQQQLATCSYDRKIILWEVASGKILRTFDGHNGAVFDLAFSPDGTVLASASADETVKLWQVATGERLDTLSQPEAEQRVVLFSPDGRFVLGAGADNRIRVWQFVSREQPQINPLLYARFAHEQALVGLAFSADGALLASAAEDGTIKVWETSDYTERHLYEPVPDLVVGLAITPDQQHVALARIDGVRLMLPIPAPGARPATSSVAPSGPAAPAGEAPAMVDLQEQEPNDRPEQAQPLTVPARIRGAIHVADRPAERDHDLFRFASAAGRQWVLEVNAARRNSPLDSRIEVLDSAGQPIERVQLQALRDSYFTFRGKDSETSDDFRLHNWEEMELNEFLYANGEVVKLWLYPRGPDSGFKVYPGAGRRYTYFDTTASAHALLAPCYIVRPHPPGAAIIPNGLPVFPVYYENDDDALRQLGADSRLTFTAPADGSYLVRITDVRGFQGSAYEYELTVRPRQPDFRVSLSGENPTVPAGSAREFSVTADRLDGFDGEIRVDISGLPPGFQVTTPLVIEAGQLTAAGIIYADSDAIAPTPENAKSTQVRATALIDGREVVRDVGNLGEIKLGEKPTLLVRLFPPDAAAVSAPPSGDWQPAEIVIAPGETITAKVRVERNGFTGAVPFGNEDSGRNLPHGVFIDNIGLNGLLVVEGQDERVFFITAAKWAPEQTRTFHLRARAEGEQASWPMILHVRRR